MKREVDCKFNKKITIFATVYDYLKDLILKDMKTDYFSQRSSIREYDNKSIPESLIRDIIERAMRASNLRKHATLFCNHYTRS